ncbi:hypothetical protein VIMS_00509 [Mycobacterium marinum]|uniref:hypothetical protein n=1 Tax=Mycobacterium marinum TaxID=1781 RepID=UPI000E3E2C84|nr:hypothetical protein [Mycobacterium marinum]RFZ21391.1 hypothetical protein VIMS_00509 [Mycobacterium marinum]
MKTDSGLAACVAAAASLGAALIHFAVLPAHWQEWPASGIFFGLIAVFQFGWAVVMPVRPHAAVLATGIVVNLGAIALWALSHSAGVPFGPHAGEPEEVGAAGIGAALLEVAVVIGAVWVWLRGNRGNAVSGVTSGIVLAGTGAVVAAIVAIGVVSGLDHGTHAPGGAGEHDHHEHPATVVPPPDQITRPPAAPPHGHDDDHSHG